MRAAFYRLLTDLVQHVPYAGEVSGAPTYGSVVERRARIEHARKAVRNAAGEFVESQALVFVEGPLSMDVRDALLLQATTPTATEIAQASPILALALVKDIDGTVHHAEAYV